MDSDFRRNVWGMAIGTAFLVSGLSPQYIPGWYRLTPKQRRIQRAVCLLVGAFGFVLSVAGFMSGTSYWRR